MNIAKYLDDGQSGTTGTVFRAQDEFGREVAVKFFNTPVGPIRDFVARHAKSLAQIKHENVVQIFDVVDLVRPDAGTVQRPNQH